MSVTVIDLETSIKCPVGNFKAHPMWTANKVVSYGVYKDGKYTGRYAPTGYEVSNFAYGLSSATMVVGQNIKFDLLYLYRNNNYLLPTIWDTQLVIVS